MKKFDVVIKKIYEYFISVVASTCNALAIFVFVNPNNFIPGGFSGLSSTLSHLLSNYLPIEFEQLMSIVYFSFNLPLLIVSLIVLRGDYTFKTILSTVCCSVVLAILPRDFVFCDSPLVASVLGGLLMGVAMYLASINNGSNGGTEVLAKIINKYHPEIDLSKVILVADIVIMSLGSVYMIFGEKTQVWVVLYSAIYVVVGSKFMGILQMGLDKPQRYSIITEKCSELAPVLSEKFQRGFSIVDIENKPNKKLIILVVQYRQTPALKRIIKTVDSEAFTYVKDVYDVFSRPLFNRSYLKK